ncbi:PAS domain-containing protein tyrosine kinase family protein [Forsythia ovata]|uniref:PAS domain-containing protein tyrosine kinase family protein n=1 Tax=Forsythia ovata TaxID=205694 RepID=A0ABD1P624_9LAMI
MSKLTTSSTSTAPGAANHRRRQRSHSVSPQRAPARRSGGGDGSVVAPWKRGLASFQQSSPLQRESNSKKMDHGNDDGGPAVKFTDGQYLNILQSMGQSVHIFDLNYRIIDWNRSAENLYGYSAAEALGQDAIELLIDTRDFAVASDIVHRVAMREGWTGQFPVKTKRGDRFLAVVTNTPFYNDDGTLVGIICVSSDSRSFQEAKEAMSRAKSLETDSSFSRQRSIASAKLGLDPQQPLQVAIASKISNFASKVSNKVKSKIRPGENGLEFEGGSGDSHHSDHGFSDAAFSDHREDGVSSGASTPQGDIHYSPFGVFSSASHEEHSPGRPSRDSGDESEGKLGLSKIITSKAGAWIGKKGLAWPWKGNEQDDGTEAKTSRFGWPWLHNDLENESGQQKSPGATSKSENPLAETDRSANIDAPGAVNKVDLDTDCFDYEILWEDLTIGEQIGQGILGDTNGITLVLIAKAKHSSTDYYLLILQTIYFVDLSEPQRRPTFQELVERLKDLQRQYTIQFHAGRAIAGDGSHKEL